MAYRYSTACFTSFLTALKTDFADGAILFYTGAQPASPDDAVTGSTYIGKATVDGGAWTAGVATNGLEFGTAADGTIAKATGEVWKFVCATAGTIGWGRFVSNSASDTGAADPTHVLKRMDFSVGITSGDCQLQKVTFAVGETYIIDTYSIPLTNRS